MHRFLPVSGCVGATAFSKPTCLMADRCLLGVPSALGMSRRKFSPPVQGERLTSIPCCSQHSIAGSGALAAHEPTFPCVAFATNAVHSLCKGCMSLQRDAAIAHGSSAEALDNVGRRLHLHSVTWPRMNGQFQGACTESLVLNMELGCMHASNKNTVCKVAHSSSAARLQLAHTTPSQAGLCMETRPAAARTEALMLVSGIPRQQAQLQQRP